MTDPERPPERCAYVAEEAEDYIDHPFVRPERPPVDPEDCTEKHHDKDGFPLPCHVCGRNGGTVEAERPPVEPLREAILSRHIDGPHKATACEWSGYGDENACPDRRAALASPAAHTALCAANGGGDPRCIACVGPSPAAPRPEGLDVERLALAIAHGSPEDVDVKDEWWTTPRALAEDILRQLARLSATSD